MEIFRTYRNYAYFSNSKLILVDCCVSSIWNFKQDFLVVLKFNLFVFLHDNSEFVCFMDIEA